jgi:hypothetical protein
MIQQLRRSSPALWNILGNTAKGLAWLIAIIAYTLLTPVIFGIPRMIDAGRFSDALTRGMSRSEVARLEVQMHGYSPQSINLHGGLRDTITGLFDNETRELVWYRTDESCGGFGRVFSLSFDKQNRLESWTEDEWDEQC